MSNRKGRQIVIRDVPDEYVERLRAVFTDLNIQVEEHSGEDIDMEELEDYEMRTFEVSEILGHRVEPDGSFTFYVLFKGFDEPEWIKDEDCYCEKLINNYLKSKGISTDYIFCRVSSTKQSQDTITFEMQETGIKENLDGRGRRIKVIKTVSSAFNKIPEDLKNLIDIANCGDVIHVFRVDRFSRNLEMALPLLNKLNSKNVEFVSHQEKITLTRDKSRLLHNVVDAQAFSEDLSCKLKRVYKIKKDRGDNFGKPRYGKMIQREMFDGKTTSVKHIDNPHEAQIIERIKKSKAKPMRMAEKLNSEGVTKRGKKWTPSMVRQVRKY